MLVVTVFPDLAPKDPATGQFEPNLEHVSSHVNTAKENAIAPTEIEDITENITGSENFIPTFVGKSEVFEGTRNNDSGFKNNDIVENSQKQEVSISIETLFSGKMISAVDADTLKVTPNGVTETIKVIRKVGCNTCLPVSCVSTGYKRMLETRYK